MVRDEASTETAFEAVDVVLQQIPIAVLVTAVNALLMALLLSNAEPRLHVLAWLASVALVAAGRLAVWFLYRLERRPLGTRRRWAIASAASATTAGLTWGLGAVLLFPQSEVYQLFWVFLNGGMSAGAASLHYPHLATAISFIIAACAPLAVRLALSGSFDQIEAAGMITVFMVALIVTAFRANSYFRLLVRLRLDLTDRSRELDAVNAKLRTEISEHRATEATLRQAYKMEAIGQLTGGIAHDFNNLLLVITGSLEILRNRLSPNDHRAAHLLGLAFDGAQRGAGLTQRLLAFGRRQLLRPEIVDIESTISGLAALLRSSVGDRVRLIFEFQPELPPIKVDKDQFELALLNLALNARDAMPGGGDLTISARERCPSASSMAGLPSGRYVVIAVTDTGIGMDETTLSRAVDPFFTTKAPGKGTGLGLSMIHGFTAQSGGQLLLTSRQGHGTLAELWFPRATSEEASREVSPAPAPPIRSSGPALFSSWTMTSWFVLARRRCSKTWDIRRSKLDPGPTH